MNPYLKAKRDQFEALRSSVEEIQNRAVAEKRDLDDTEMTALRGQAEKLKALGAEIELLTEQENRAADVAELSAKLDDRTEKRQSDASTQDRDPGHYRKEEEGGQFSFFADQYRAKFLGDESAKLRLTEHNRALSTAGEGVGIIAPKWMTEEFQAIARAGRPLANAVRRIPLGMDPRPITIPKQTAGTDANVVDQAAEGDDITWTDAYDTDVDTVTPKATAGGQIVSRQMLDMSSPAVDQLIFGDLVAAYNEKVEAKVGAAIVTAAGAANTTFATEAAFIADEEVAVNAIIDAAIAVRMGRKLPADLLILRARRWGALKKLRDTTGRPLVPFTAEGAQAVNVNGVGSVNADGMIEGLAAIVTEGIGTTGYAESMVVQRASDVLLFESNQLRFNDPYSEGPAKVRLAIWAYVGVHVRYAGTSGERIEITAAS